MNKRRPIIAGNWKMFKTKDEALEFIYQVNVQVPDKETVESVIFTPSIFLRDLVKREGENLRVGAQNMHELEEGAYTGEISAPMLKSYGVKYVIVGHSERREYFNETDQSVNKKAIQAIQHEITPIICVGESLTIREEGTTDEYVQKQITKSYAGIARADVVKTVIAYEPIWAIGTGRTATPEQANDTIKMIRKTLASLYDVFTADQVRILYGGSVKPSNIASFLQQSDIDGALVGGASLEPASYLALVQAATE